MKFAGLRPVGIRQKISWPRVKRRGYDVFFAARKSVFNSKEKERKKVSKIERKKERKKEREKERAKEREK